MTDNARCDERSREKSQSPRGGESDLNGACSPAVGLNIEQCYDEVAVPQACLVTGRRTGVMAPHSMSNFSKGFS